MSETVTQLTPTSAMSGRHVMLFVKKVHPGQNASGPLSMNW